MFASAFAAVILARADFHHVALNQMAAVLGHVNHHGTIGDFVETGNGRWLDAVRGNIGNDFVDGGKHFLWSILRDGGLPEDRQDGQRGHCYRGGEYAGGNHE